MRLIKAILLSLMLVTFSHAAFDLCKFNFGTDWDFLNKNQSSSVATSVDYVTIWLVDPSFNSGWHGAMLKFCKTNNKTPVFYSYIIAKASALGDADVGGALAKKGANFIRNNWSDVTSRYESYAAGAASSFGTTDPIIWLMEPDYYQYAASTQEGGGLSYQQLGSKMSELIAIIKKHLPNALISMDISAWEEDQGQTSAWFNAMPLSSMNFINTSGGKSDGNSSIIVNPNKMTWSGVYGVTKKGIIADAGYGTGGGATGENASWNDVNNLKSRIADGVIAITQKNPSTNWGNTIATLRTQLANQTTKSCNGTPTKPKYSLSVTTSGPGNVTVSPQATTYDSGSTVSLTAVPTGGSTFSGWSGALSGSNATTSIVMNSNKTVTASFSGGTSKPTYTLSLATSGSGNVTVTPQAASYDSGTTVNLTAVPSSGQSFTGWSGALSGSNTTASILMNSNKTVSAAFTGNNIITGTNLVKNGDFSNGTTGWTFGVYNSASATESVSNGEHVTTTTNAGSDAWNIQLTQSGIQLEQGKSYTVSFTARAASATTIVVNVGQSSGDYKSYSQEQTENLTTQNNNFSFTFIASASDANARIEFNSGKSNVTYYLDNVSITQQGIGVLKRPLSRNAGLSKFDKGSTVAIYDHSGRLIRKLSNLQQLSALELPKTSGISFLVITNGSNRIVKSIVTTK